MVFEESLVRLLKHEGGYSDDPRDNGGETFKGVSRKFFPRWGGWTILDAYTDKHNLDEPTTIMLDKEVSEFYYTYFWIKLRCDQIQNSFIAEMLFNIAVNTGKKTASKKIQRVLGVVADGVVGPVTIAALNDADSDTFLYHFIIEVVDFYLTIGKSQPHYLSGWLNRIMSFYYRHERSK